MQRLEVSGAVRPQQGSLGVEGLSFQRIIFCRIDVCTPNEMPCPVIQNTWTNKARDARRITAAEMKYMRRTAGYTWRDYKTNAQIANELK